MKDYIKELFEYNHHCNQRLATVVEASEVKLPKRCMDVFNHIINAHHIWNRRILNQKPLYNVWAVSPTGELSTMDRDNYMASLEIIENADLEAGLDYSTSKGQPFSNKVKDIMFHIINHSTYHRGQIAMFFRESGIAPEISDYIFYKRS